MRQILDSCRQQLVSPIQDLEEIFFHMKVSNSKSQTLTTSIQDSNHERKEPSERTCKGTRRGREEWRQRGISTATATERFEPRGAPWGVRSHAAGRAVGREELRHKAASTHGGGGKRSPRDGRAGGVAALRRSPSRHGDGARSEALRL